MAVRVGIQWVDPSKDGQYGDPFRCPPCNRFFNASRDSLLKHLRETHGDQHSPQKRKLESLTPQNFTVPTLHVSGCSRCDVVSNVIRGQYTATRWCHGKPVYEKDGIRSVSVLIYFWDERDGPTSHGWWFGPKEGSQLVWAYNSSNCSQEDLTVPTSGWKVPWDGEVDPTLEITTHDDTDAKTKRRRDRMLDRMRSKLAKKDAEVERLQNKRNHLVEEKNDLMAKIAQLEQEKQILESSQADHVAQMMLQETWRTSRQLQTKICTELNHQDVFFLSIQQALVEACPKSHYGDCSRFRNVSITGVQQICNVRIWKDYEFRKEQVRKELEGREAVPIVASNLPPLVCKWAHLDGKINEILLLHGTTQDKIEQIASFGFDERLARENGLYGQGVYFTDQSCKGLQYSGANYGHTGCFIVARVILGHPINAVGPLKSLKVEPLVDQTNPCKGRCHSVIAHPGIPNGKGMQKQVHREYVLFNGAQAYPEFIVNFKISQTQ